jgi:hypothetical protein
MSDCRLTTKTRRSAAVLGTATLVAAAGCGGSSRYDADRTNACLRNHHIRTSLGRKVNVAYGEWEQDIAAYFPRAKETDIVFYKDSSSARAGQGLVPQGNVGTEYSGNVQWNWVKPVPRHDDAVIRACLR